MPELTEASNLLIRDLRPEDEAAVRELVLAGLEEHWGWLDESLNLDLKDLWDTYRNETFLTAWLGDVLVGSGALIREEAGVGRIVRMSVVNSARRKGVGRALLQALIGKARERGFLRVVLETTETWEDARAFYRANGFTFQEIRNGDAHFLRDL